MIRVAEKIDKQDGKKYLIEMDFNTHRVDLLLNSVDIKVSLDDDLKEYKWVDIKDIGVYKHTPPSEKLFKSLGWI